MNFEKTTDKAIEQVANTVNKASSTAQHLADNALQGARNTIEATRDAANASMDRAEENVKQWRSEASPAISDLADKAQALAERSINYCAQTGVRLRQQVDGCTEATTRYVTQQPGKSVLMAAAAGAALGVAAMALSRRRGN